MDNTIQPNQQDDVQLHHYTQDSRELSPKTTQQTAKLSAKRLKNCKKNPHPKKCCK